jgi:hypothetical protein
VTDDPRRHPVGGGPWRARLTERPPPGSPYRAAGETPRKGAAPSVAAYPRDAADVDSLSKVANMGVRAAKLAGAVATGTARLVQTVDP